MHIITSNGKDYQGKMEVLNFWRSTFDRWLNDLAVEDGAIFQDKCRMVEYEDVEGGYLLHLQSGTSQQEVFTRYLVAADGMYSKVRQKLRPDHFLQKAPGGAMNYYCTGEGDLDLQRLDYIFALTQIPIASSSNRFRLRAPVLKGIEVEKMAIDGAPGVDPGPLSDHYGVSTVIGL